MTRGRLVLLGSARDWLGSSLTAVLEPSGFRLEQVATGNDLLQRVESVSPDVVIVDESLVDLPVATLCRRLAPTIDQGPPILLYSSGDWSGSDRAPGWASSAWDHIEEPIRSGQLLAKLERLSRLKDMLEAARQVAGGPGTGSESVGGLLRIMALLGSIAERANAEVGCAVVGPTRTAATPEGAESMRAETLSLITGQIRGSDVCAWLGPAELAVVLYGSGIDGLGAFVGRLAGVRGAGASGAGGRPISAGLVSLNPERGGEGHARGLRTPQVLGPLEAACDALQRAREAGGGVRVAVPA